ncbi:MAG TPA: PIN domain-containing protein [Opitutaceae bacterium]|nr:PIN domain-containing protein [Opitutaceae bacterium]
MIYLPDTNAFSRYLRGEDLGLKAKLEANLIHCRLSSIVLSELEYGVAKRPEVATYATRIKRLRELIPGEVDYTSADAAYYGFIRARLANLKPNAQPIGPYHLMLAAQALRLGAAIVTHNTSEFERVPGLAVEDWQTRA